MKRIVAIALVMLMGMSIIGCGKDKRTDAEKFVGKWELISDEDPESWQDTMVVFSDGTAYSVTYPNINPDNRIEMLWNSWIMENGSLKTEITTLGVKDVDVWRYEFIDSDTFSYWDEEFDDGDHAIYKRVVE